jgi:hypothetical protein
LAVAEEGLHPTIILIAAQGVRPEASVLRVPASRADKLTRTGQKVFLTFALFSLNNTVPVKIPQRPKTLKKNLQNAIDIFSKLV